LIVGFSYASAPPLFLSSPPIPSLRIASHWQGLFFSLWPSSPPQVSFSFSSSQSYSFTAVACLFSKPFFFLSAKSPPPSCCPFFSFAHFFLLFPGRLNPLFHASLWFFFSDSPSPSRPRLPNLPPPSPLPVAFQSSYTFPSSAFQAKHFSFNLISPPGWVPLRGFFRPCPPFFGDCFPLPFSGVLIFSTGLQSKLPHTGSFFIVLVLCLHFEFCSLVLVSPCSKSSKVVYCVFFLKAIGGGYFLCLTRFRVTCRL